MLALTEVIDFLLNLMRDETARAEFEQDPQGTLARAGLEGVTGQDIADARLLLADSGTVSSSADDGGGAVAVVAPGLCDGAVPHHAVQQVRTRRVPRRGTAEAVDRKAPARRA